MNGFTALILHQPVRMLPGNVGLRLDLEGCQPQARGKSFEADLTSQPLPSVWELVVRSGPIPPGSQRRVRDWAVGRTSGSPILIHTSLLGPNVCHPPG